MTVSNELEGVTGRERHRIKARAFAALTNQVGRSITRGRFTVTLTSAPTFADDVMTFSIRTERDGIDITPAELNPIRVVNPPILVPDPAGTIVRVATDPRDGTVTESRYREDLPAAMISIVRGLLR